MPFATNGGFCQENGGKRADIGECGSPAEIASCDLYFVKMQETAPQR
jgi:hypothetical protein